MVVDFIFSSHSIHAVYILYEKICVQTENQIVVIQ